MINCYPNLKYVQIVWNWGHFEDRFSSHSKSIVFPWESELGHEEASYALSSEIFQDTHAVLNRNSPGHDDNLVFEFHPQ